MSAKSISLAARIQASLLDVERVVDRAQFLLMQAKTHDDDGYLDGVALNLHGFYAGVERIFEDIARTMEGAVPQGPEWHRGLLLQMATKVNSIRPAAISPCTRSCLDEYRGFRHIVRNVYTFNLRPTRLRELTEDLRPCYEATVHDLTNFVAFLEELHAMDSD